MGRPGRTDVPVITAVDQFSPIAAEKIVPRYVVLSLNGRAMTVGELRRAAARLRSGDLVSLVLADPTEEPRPVPLIVNYRVP